MEKCGKAQPQIHADERGFSFLDFLIRVGPR
jgi:hypothetical protein